MSKKTSVFPQGHIDRSNWKRVRLSELFTFGNGYTPSKTIHAYWHNGTIPWFRMEDIRTNGHILKDSIQHITPNAINGRGLFPAGSYILSTTATLGEYALLIADSLANQRFTFLVKNVNRTSEVNEVYFLHFLAIIGDWCKKSANAGGLLAVNMFDLKNYEFLLPPVEEQHRIATVLSSVEEQIATLQSLISKYESIKKATVNLLLKQNQGWRNVKLGDVLKVCHGKCQHLIESEAGLFPILATSGEIGRANQFLYDKPSVLIGRKGTIDKPQYIETPFWTIDTLFYTKIADGYIPKFVFYLCQTIDWASLNEASGVPSLSANRIESIEVCVPQNMHEQKRIVAALDSIDNTIKGLKTQLEKSQAIKHGMMSYFFG